MVVGSMIASSVPRNQPTHAHVIFLIMFLPNDKKVFCFESQCTSPKIQLNIGTSTGIEYRDRTEDGRVQCYIELSFFSNAECSLLQKGVSQDTVAGNERQSSSVRRNSSVTCLNALYNRVNFLERMLISWISISCYTRLFLISVSVM